MYKIPVFGLFIGLVSCGYRQLDTLKFGAEDYRCATDGFCLYATGKYSLQAGFREGDAEIRVDVVDAQTQHGNSPQNYAVLVSDQHANPLMLSAGHRIPASWHVRHQDSHAVKNISQFSAERDVREKLTQKLADSLQMRGSGEDIKRQEAYVIARQIIEDMVERDDNFRKGSPSAIPKRWQKKLQGEKSSLPSSSSILPFFYASYDGPDLQEALAVGSVQSAGRDDSAYRELQQQLQPHVSGGPLDGYLDDRSDYVSLLF